MKQLQYLNFYKVISNFATLVLAAFVPFMVYQAMAPGLGSTVALILAFATYGGEILFRTVFDISFKRLYAKYPQIFLLIRVLPIIISSLSVFLISSSMPQYAFWLGVIMFDVFLGMSNSFKMLPMENIFNYSSTADNTGIELGKTRFFEEVGEVAALVLGGILLDSLPEWVIIVVAIIAYLGSVIPLLLYYFKEKKNPAFNQESVSNAIGAYKPIKMKNIELATIRKRMTLGYGLLFALILTIETLPTAMSLLMFVQGGAAHYAYAGYVFALLWAGYGICSVIIAKIDEKKDITTLVSISAIITAALVCAVPFLGTVVWAVMLLSFLIGCFYAVISYFVLERMLTKTRIAGVSNQAQFARIVGINTGQFVPAAVCLFGSVFPGFFITAVMLIAYAVYAPIHEERSRKRLVNYLSNNKLY